MAAAMVLPSPPDRAAYVVGANDGSVARVDLDTGAVVSNLFAVGAGGNRAGVNDDLSRAVVVNSSSDQVTLIDLATESVLASVPLPVGSNPWGAAWDGDRVFVSALLLDTIYVVDSTAGAVVDSVVVGKAPEGMAIANGKLYVANTGFDFSTFGYDPGSVSVVDLGTLSLLATVAVGTNPQECLRAPDGTVHVVCTGDFGATSGEVDVLDPLTDTVIATLPVPGYPGGGCALGAHVFLNVTTPAFASEVRGYEIATLAWVWDETNPLLPSFDFYGNLRASSSGDLLVCDFSADLLLVESPIAPGSPQAYLVGDGPIDAAVVERGGPVALAISGLSATDTILGVRLGWSASLELGLAGFVVERSDAGEAWRVLATDVPAARTAEWTDRAAPTNRVLRYRIGARTGTGDTLYSAPVAIQRRARGEDRLAVRRVVPNPSRGAARFDLYAPHAGSLRLELFDVAGRRVRELRGSTRGGEQTLPWDGLDDRGRAVPPGPYFARLTLGSEVTVSRVMRLR